MLCQGVTAQHSTPKTDGHKSLPIWKCSCNANSSVDIQTNFPSHFCCYKYRSVGCSRKTMVCQIKHSKPLPWCPVGRLAKNMPPLTMCSAIKSIPEWHNRFIKMKSKTLSLNLSAVNPTVIQVTRLLF